MIARLIAWLLQPSASTVTETMRAVVLYSDLI